MNHPANRFERLKLREKKKIKAGTTKSNVRRRELNAIREQEAQDEVQELVEAIEGVS